MSNGLKNTVSFTGSLCRGTGAIQQLPFAFLATTVVNIISTGAGLCYADFRKFKQAIQVYFHVPVVPFSEWLL